MSGNLYRCIVGGSLNSNAATLTVNALPSVTLVLPFDTLYQKTSLQQLSGGSPAGGLYTGQGINGTSFITAAIPVGNYTVTYKYTDANGCTSTATDNFAIIPNVSLVNIYPNPAQDGKLTVVFAPELLGGTAVVYSESGQKVGGWRITSRYAVYQFKWPAGVYYMNCSNGSVNEVKKLVLTR
jgi:hypothetical protein